MILHHLPRPPSARTQCLRLQLVPDKASAPARVSGHRLYVQCPLPWSLLTSIPRALAVAQVRARDILLPEIEETAYLVRALHSCPWYSHRVLFTSDRLKEAIRYDR